MLYVYPLATGPQRRRRSKRASQRSLVVQKKREGGKIFLYSSLPAGIDLAALLIKEPETRSPRIGAGASSLWSTRSLSQHRPLRHLLRYLGLEKWILRQPVDQLRRQAAPHQDLLHLSAVDIRQTPWRWRVRLPGWRGPCATGQSLFSVVRPIRSVRSFNEGH
jgi:hypothetical protein